METIGFKIKYLRKALDLTQPQLAAMLQVSNAVISFWENDINEPKASYIVKLSKVFSVSADYLLGNEEEDGRTIVDETNLPDDERLMLEYYRRLTAELKSHCLEYVKSIDRLNEKLNSGRK